MKQGTRDILTGREPSGRSVNTVTDVPEAFKGWVEKNRGSIARAKSKPYFVTDNPKYTGAEVKTAKAQIEKGGVTGKENRINEREIFDRGRVRRMYGDWCQQNLKSEKLKDGSVAKRMTIPVQGEDIVINKGFFDEPLCQ